MWIIGAIFYFLILYLVQANIVSVGLAYMLSVVFILSVYQIKFNR